MCPSFRLASVLSVRAGYPPELSLLCIIPAYLQALNETLLISYGYEYAACLVNKGPLTAFLTKEAGNARKVIPFLAKLLCHHTHSRNRRGLVTESVDLRIGKTSVTQILTMVLRQTQFG